MRNTKKTVKIGVCGIHTAAGATHVSQLLALYLAGSRRKKTAVIETDGKAALRQLERYLFGSAGEGRFSVRRCVYRYDEQEEAEPAADYIIYDAGSGKDRRHEWLFSCNLCIAVGSGGVFYRREWEDFLQAGEVREQICLRGIQNWRFIKNHAETGACETLTLYPDGKKSKIKVYGLGSEENLLHLSGKAQKLMKRMDI